MSVLDTVNNVTDSVTGMVRLIVLLIMAAIAMFLIFTYFAADNAVDKLGERAERVGSEAIVAAREEARNAQLAQDGWGYDAGREETKGSQESRRGYSDDWGDPQ